MRLLLVTNDYPPRPGGIQQYLGNLVSRHDGPARVLAPSDPAAPATPEVVRGARGWMLPTPSTRAWIIDHVAGFKPDVVVYGAPTPLAQLGPAVRHRTGVPFIVMTHGAEVTVPGVVPGLRQILAWTFRRADGLFAVSRYTARRVAAISGCDALVLGAGVDTDAFHPAEPAGRRGQITIGCVSRFTPRKGHIRVIAAAEGLAARGIPVEVVLAGKGRLERRIRRRASRSSVPVDLQVNPQWAELPDLYRRFDVFVMPARSRWLGLEVEGLGIVYLEAAATGLPVVTGWSGGAPETVIPGVTGYVAERVPHIVEAIERIALKPEMGREARRVAEATWTWDSVMERWHRGLALATGATRT